MFFVTKKPATADRQRLGSCTVRPVRARRNTIAGALAHPVELGDGRVCARVHCECVCVCVCVCVDCGGGFWRRKRKSRLKVPGGREFNIFSDTSSKRKHVPRVYDIGGVLPPDITCIFVFFFFAVDVSHEYLPSGRHENETCTVRYTVCKQCVI